MSFICSDAEKMWASRIISDESEITPPPAETYFEAVKFKGIYDSVKE